MEGKEDALFQGSDQIEKTEKAMTGHTFEYRPIPLHRNAVEKTCSLCGSRSWRYKDGSRWVERPVCYADPKNKEKVVKNIPEKL